MCSFTNTLCAIAGDSKKGLQHRYPRYYTLNRKAPDCEVGDFRILWPLPQNLQTILFFKKKNPQFFLAKYQKNPQIFLAKYQKNPQIFLAKYQKNPQIFIPK